MERVYTYEQATGRLFRPDMQIAGTGYSGFGPSRNKPEDERKAGLGPIPCGVYRVGPPHENVHLGHYVCDLFPEDDTDTFDRTLFRLHGDSKEHPGLASHGCIIQGPLVRHEVVASGLRIRVVAHVQPMEALPVC